MKHLKLISLLAMAMVAVPAFATTVGEGSSVVVPGADGPVVIPAGQPVPDGVDITAEEGKISAIVLDNGSVIAIKPGATVKVDGNKVEILAGEIYASEVVANAKAPIVVRSTLGTISGIKGTISINVSAENETVTSIEGVWRVQSGTGAVRALGEGQTVILSTDGKILIRNARPNEMAAAKSVLDTIIAPTIAENPAAANGGAPVVPGQDHDSDTPMSGADR